MKTLIQRMLSVVLCVVLVLSTMSVTAFGAGAEESFSYKTYAQNATKENVHYLLDALDEKLKEADIYEEMGLGYNIDMRSIDAICRTIDKFRTEINLGTFFLNVGDLKELELKYFDKKLSRDKSGDIKILTEFIDLAYENIGIINKFLAGNLSLGKIGEKLGVTDKLKEIDISTSVKEGVADALFKDSPNLAAAKANAVKNFDSFVYTNLMGLVKEAVPFLKDVTLNADTTVDALVTDIFTAVINEAIAGISKDNSFTFASLGSEFAGLDSVIKLNGISSVTFASGSSFMAQVNNVLGSLFGQMVPGYASSWTKGDYTKIGANMRGLVRYIADKSGVVKSVSSKSDEQLMLEVSKIIVNAGDDSADKGAYLAIKDTKSLTEMVNALFRYLGRDVATYTDNHTYEHVIGDWLIDKLGSEIPLYDEKGKELSVGAGKTVWEVLNSVLNFFLVDKNMDSFIGKTFTKGSTYFEKLDILLDMTGNNGTADFNSEEYIKGLVDCMFKVDLQGFINATAVKAINYAGKEKVVSFLCKTGDKIINNWSDSSAVVSAKTFNDAFSNTNIANLVTAVIETLNRRSEGTQWTLGVLYGALDNSVSEKVTVNGKAATCTKSGLENTKRCLKCSKDIVTNSTVIPATGHHEKKPVETSATCTEDGSIKTQCAVCDTITKTTVLAAKGHKYDSGKITKKATCTTDGVKTYTCTVCKETKTETVSATGHKEGTNKVTKNATCTAKGTRTYYCSVCEKGYKTKDISAKGHKEDSGTVTKKATCTQTGTKTYNCSTCKVKLRSETIPATGHKEGTNKVTKNATCTAKGTRTYYCSVCKSGYKTKSVSATGHKYDSGKITKKATCTADGVKIYTCTACKTTKTETVSATGHKIGSNKITKAPTCTKSGTKTYYCSVCKGSVKTETLAKKGHKETGYKTTKKATYKATGLKVNKCTVCSATLGKKTVSRLTLKKPTGLKASAVSTTSIKYSWKKVTGAESYIVYYKTKTGSTKTVTTKKTSVTVKKLKAGLTYDFRVVAVAGKYKSKESSSVSSTTKPAAVSLKSVKSSKKKEVAVAWSKVMGATGYEVQYSTSKKFTKKTTKTVTTKKVKATIKKLKSKKTYYVRVRAYKTFNKKPVYGAYSKVKSVKCK